MVSSVEHSSRYCSAVSRELDSWLILILTGLEPEVGFLPALGRLPPCFSVVILDQLDFGPLDSGPFFKFGS